jgi:hypothetical protein
MKRANVLLLMTMAAVGLLLLAISTMTDPGSSRAAPLAQTAETEPNNTFAEADFFTAPGSATGVLTQTSTGGDSEDYYEFTTTIGDSYEAALSILYSEVGMEAEITLYHGNRNKVSGPSTSIISWSAVTDTYYILVESNPALTTTAQLVSYRVRIDRLDPTSTATASPTPTNTPPPSVTEGDNYETHSGYTNNNNYPRAYELPVSTSVSLSTLEGLANFYPGDSDHDWFRFWAKDGKWYQVTTSSLSGVDTFLEIFDEDIKGKYSDDDGAGGYASTVSWKAAYDGWYYIRVTNVVNTTGSYNMTMEESDSPAKTPTPVPQSPSGDSCENNPSFGDACIIAADKEYTFNLIPPYSNGSDNDYFKLWVKPDFHYDCYTSDPDPGVDPNMILFWGPSDDNLIGGNDDREDKPGDLNSRVTYFSTYEGWMYVLVGTGDRTPPDINNSEYSLQCMMQLPGEPTPTSTPKPAATQSPQQTSAPPTPTPSDELSIRPLVTPTPAPAATPASQFIPVTLLVYYDGNNDHQAGAGEGISGVSAQAYEAATNQLLAQGFTDEQGNLEFTLAALGPARVTVPFFGFSQLVAGEGASIYLRVPPQSLPEAP